MNDFFTLARLAFLCLLLFQCATPIDVLQSLILGQREKIVSDMISSSIDFYRYFFTPLRQLAYQEFTLDIPTIHNKSAFCHDKLKYYKHLDDCLLTVNAIMISNTIKRTRNNVTVDRYLLDDISMKFLIMSYEGIQSHHAITSTFPEEKASTTSITNLNYHNICIFGSFSVQVLRAIALVHDKFTNNTLHIKYFISKLNLAQLDASYKYVREIEITLAEIYEQIMSLQEEFPFLALEAYEFSHLDMPQNIPPNILSSCEILHWREVRKERITRYTSEEVVDSYKESSMENEETQTLNAQLHALATQFALYTIQQQSIPIILEKGRFSNHVDWMIHDANDPENDAGSMLRWHTIARCRGGMIMDTIQHFKKQSFGSRLGKSFEYLQFLAVETFVGELVPSSSSSSQMQINNDLIDDINDDESYFDHLLRESILFITFEANLFIETAHGLKAALHVCGFQSVYIMGIFDYALYRRYFQYAQTAHVPIIQIALGPQLPSVLIANYIVFHTENSWDIFSSVQNYHHVINNALAVFVYSAANIEFMHSIGRYDDLYIIPMYSQSLYFHADIKPISSFSTLSLISGGAAASRTEIIISELIVPQEGEGAMKNYATFEKISTTEAGYFDVCFLASSSPRREKLRQEFQAKQKDTANSPINFLFGGIPPAVDAGDIYSREYITVHCRVMLNIHQYEESILETHRINHLLSLGKVIISERSSVDPTLDGEYEEQGAVIFVTLEDMYDTAAWWLLHEEARQAQEKRALEKYVSLQANVSSLQHAMMDIITHSKLELYEQ